MEKVESRQADFLSRVMLEKKKIHPLSPPAGIKAEDCAAGIAVAGIGVEPHGRAALHALSSHDIR